VAALSCAPKVLHFGSVSLTHECARNATLAAVKEAKNRGITVSYDPNYRPALWQAESLAISYMAMPLSLVDILKISDDELPLLSGTHDSDAGTRLLCEQGISLVLVTLGPNGVYYRMGENTGIIPGIPVKVADTNGAGDTFLGAVLARLCRREDGILTNLSTPELEDILTFANRAAALTCSRPGAIPAMPKLSELI
jgi:fructokinase